MARISGISQRIPSAEPLKLLALVFDILILLSSTGDDVHKCELGSSSSSSPEHSSTLGIVLAFAFLFCFTAIGVLIIKYSFWYRMNRHCSMCQEQFSKCDCSEYDICCCGCTKCKKPIRVCTCMECAATNEGKCCCCNCHKIVTFTVNSGNRSQCSHIGNGSHQCSTVCECCGLPDPDKKMKCYKRLKISAFIFYDFVSIIMGVLFLLGDNLTDDICVFFNCGNFHVHNSTCKLLENGTIDKGGKIYNYSNCTNEFAIQCRTASVFFLGTSTILNILLSYLTFKSIHDKGFPSIGKQHKLWISTLSLLSLIIIIDQTTTGLYTSVFKLTRNETNICSDLKSIHSSASITYLFSISVWIIILIWHCCENWPEKELSCARCFLVINSLCLLAFYIVYIFVDTPWPWDCFETNDIYDKKAGIKARFGLVFCIVSPLIGWFTATYIIIVAIPALRVQKNAKLVLDDEDVMDEFRRWTRRKYISLRQEGSGELFQSETFNENITSASYEISIIKDYNWQTELKEMCTCCNN